MQLITYYYIIHATCYILKMSHTDHQSIGLFNPVCQTDPWSCESFNSASKKAKNKQQ